MKKCPVCKAEIPDNARFCIHCMTAFTEKENIQPPAQDKRRWSFVLSCFLALGLLIALLILLSPTDTGSAPESTNPSQMAQTGHTFTGPSENSPQTDGASLSQTQGQPAASQPQVDMPAPPIGPVSPTTPPTTKPAEITPPQTTEPVQPTTPPETTAPSKPTAPVETTEPTQQTTPLEITVPPETTLPQETTLPAETEPSTQPPSQSIFTYRAANAGDDPYGTVDPSLDIVITGVKTPAADGVYRVPSYIDGKRVIAIGNIAFNGTDARSVTLGETVRCVGQDAFKGCYNIHSLYLQADAVFMSRSVFTDAYRRNCTLTIYGSAGCTERQTGSLFRDIVSSRYGAIYQEWNG